MAWGALLVPEALPQFLAILGMLALAGVLFYLGPGRRVNQLFAMFLVFRAGMMLSATLHGLYNLDPPDAIASARWAGMEPFFALAIPATLIYFACAYPKPRWFFGTHRAGPILLLAATLAMELAYVADPSLWATYGLHESGRWIRMADGPGLVIRGLVPLGYGILAWLFARDHGRMAKSPRRNSLLYITVGFTVNALFDGSLGLFAVTVGGFEASVVLVARALALVPALAAAAELCRQYARADEQGHKGRLVRALLVVPFPILSGLLPFAFPDLTSRFLLLTGFWRLAFPALVTYALIRYDLFDIDLKIKWTLEKSTIAGIIAGVFFVASEGVEQLIAVDGTLAGLAAAGGVALAMRPLQTVAHRMADVAMPGVEDSQAYQQERALEIYRATYEESLLDGELTDRELRVLENVRQQLGISQADARRVQQRFAQP